MTAVFSHNKSETLIEEERAGQATNEHQHNWVKCVHGKICTVEYKESNNAISKLCASQTAETLK